MSYHSEALQRLMDSYTGDPELRAQIASDPQGSAKRFGISLTEATPQTLQSVDGISAADGGGASSLPEGWGASSSQAQ